MYGVPGGRLARQSTLGQKACLLEARLILPGERQQGDIPPVVAICRGKALDELPGLLLYVGHSRERDRGHRCGHRKRVARVVGDVRHESSGSCTSGVLHAHADEFYEAPLTVVRATLRCSASGTEGRLDISGCTSLVAH